MKDVVVIIRSCGERTFRACRELVLKQIPAEALEVVNERPFEQALRQTYEIGIQRNAKWTMTLDADVLLGEGMIEKFVAEAESLPESFIQIEGLVHDKLTGLYRQAGHRIYRTKYLREALLQISQNGKEIRPEYATLQRMEKLGFPSRRIDLVVGTHDYEQYYRDIYRKAFVHANKHQNLLADLVCRWKKLMITDADFRIALRGLYDGLMSLNTAKIDTHQYVCSSAAAIKELGLHEKQEFGDEWIGFELVNQQLERAGTAPQNNLQGLETAREKLKTIHKQVGLLRMIPLLGGVGLCRIGNYIKRFGSATPLDPSE